MKLKLGFGVLSVFLTAFFLVFFSLSSCVAVRSGMLWAVASCAPVTCIRETWSLHGSLFYWHVSISRSRSALRGNSQYYGEPFVTLDTSETFPFINTSPITYHVWPPIEMHVWSVVSPSESRMILLIYHSGRGSPLIYKSIWGFILITSLVSLMRFWGLSPWRCKTML